MIKFVLMVNKMGQTRVSSYYDWMPIPERVALEAEVVRRCFSRSELQCSFFEFRGYKIIYRRVSKTLLCSGKRKLPGVDTIDMYYALPLRMLAVLYNFTMFIKQ